MCALNTFALLCKCSSALNLFESYLADEIITVATRMAEPVTVYTPVFGRLEAFEPEGENISTYLEHIELYFLANGIAENKQASVLLTVIGMKNYGIIKSLVALAQPKDKSYVELVATLKEHFQPKPLITYGGWLLPMNSAIFSTKPFVTAHEVGKHPKEAPS